MITVSVPSRSWIEDLGPVENVEFIAWDLSEPHDRGPDVVMVVPPYRGLSSNLEQLADLPELRAVQMLTAGYEDAQSYIPKDVVLANGAGIHDASTAEHAVGLAIASLRGYRDHFAAQSLKQQIYYTQREQGVGQ